MRSDHRPWPVPRKPWIMRQVWHRLLFAHWRIEGDRLRRFVPDGLRLDECDGSAWIGILPFHATGIRLRLLPPIPPANAFAELNVRTYVTADGKPGVFFFSLDATNLAAVLGARLMFKLPYDWADIDVKREGETGGETRYRCVRRRAGDCRFEASYAPVGEAYHAAQGSLDYWLTERYCLYASRGRKLYRGDILHEPWTLRRAEADIRANTMLTPVGLTLPANEKPLLHYAERQEVLIWGLDRIGK